MENVHFIVVNSVDPKRPKIALLGQFETPVLPRVGEALILNKEYFIVADVEHIFDYVPGEAGKSFKPCWHVTVAYRCPADSGPISALPWWENK